MNTFTRCLALALVVALPRAVAADTPADPEDAVAPTSLDALAWMAGHWTSNTDGVLSEELWMAPAGDLMLGLNRTSSAEGASFEYLRIQVDDDGAIAYVPSPSGTESVHFALVEAHQGYAAFANPDHDFPSLITYTLSPDGATLAATISGAPGGEPLSMTFVWMRATP